MAVRKAATNGLAFVLALAVGVVGLAGPVAADGVPVDPDAAVAYQQNPAHDGSVTDPGFVAPFRRAWTRTFEGKVGYPLVAAGRVFVAIAPTYEFGNKVAALSIDDGSLLWGPVSIGGSDWSGSIAYDDGRVFAIDSDGGVTAFDATTGDVIWDTQLTGQWGFRAPVTASKGLVLVEGDGVGGTLYALDQGTGELSWSVDVMGGGRSAPAVDDTGVYVSYDCHDVVKLDLLGNERWHRSGSCTGGGATTPVLHDGKVWVREFLGDPPYLLDAMTGEDLPGTFGPFSGIRAPAFDGRVVATVGGGTLTVSDTVTGETLWQAPTSGHALAPLIANHYVISVNGDAVVEARLVQTGALVWSAPQGSSLVQAPDELGSDILTGMAVGDGTLLVPGEDVLAAFVPVGPAADTTPPTVALRPFLPHVVDTPHAVARWRAEDERSGVLATQIRTRAGRVGFPLSNWVVRPRQRTLGWWAAPIQPGWRLCVSVRSQDGVGNWSDWTSGQCVRRRG